MILNIGCGNQEYGDVRVDIMKTPTTTHIFSLEKDFPLDNETFDEIYCNSVLEHIKNLQGFSSECYRLLKKGGKLKLRTDNAGYLPFHLFKSHEHNRFLDKQYEGDSYSHKKGEDAHYHLFVESHLRKLFKDFSEINITYVYGGRSKLNKFLLNLLPKKMGAIHIEIEAIK